MGWVGGNEALALMAEDATRTYHARQADLTGGAANFFLVTPLGAAAGRTVIACSVMTDR